MLWTVAIFNTFSLKNTQEKTQHWFNTEKEESLEGTRPNKNVFATLCLVLLLRELPWTIRKCFYLGRMKRGPCLLCERTTETQAHRSAVNAKKTGNGFLQVRMTCNQNTSTVFPKHIWNVNQAYHVPYQNGPILYCFESTEINWVMKSFLERVATASTRCVVWKEVIRNYHYYKNRKNGR